MSGRHALHLLERRFLPCAMKVEACIIHDADVSPKRKEIILSRNTSWDGQRSHRIDSGRTFGMKWVKYRGSSPRQSSRPVQQYPEPILTISTFRTAAPAFVNCGFSSPCRARSSDNRTGAARGSPVKQNRTRSAAPKVDDDAILVGKQKESPIVGVFEIV